ncbi:MAG: type II toxin-antitoxin system MqsA family antitoxin [Deltaproteobacteria bacterium]|nr:type II toxin-antitoxin system MqsA family antitoxin [Deltaproteobacteria bacterium]
MFTLRNGRLCPVCEKGKLKEKTKALLFTYKDRSKRIPNQKVYTCNICDYEGLTRADNDKIEKVLTDFRRTIDGLLPCDKLRSIREESLRLNKKAMANLLSVNEKTVGRYENGKVTQSSQVDKLYRLLQANPFLARTIEPNVPVTEYRFYPETLIKIEKDNYNPEPADGYDVQTKSYDQRIKVHGS